MKEYTPYKEHSISFNSNRFFNVEKTIYPFKIRFCFAVFCVLSGHTVILMEKKACCFTLFVFLVSCDCFCSVDLPRGAVGWSAGCECGYF